MPSQVLVLKPDKKLIFEGPFDRKVKSMLQLHNPTDSKVVFKVKSSASEQFYTQSKQNQLLMPGETTSLYIIYLGEGKPVQDCTTHLVMVQSLMVPAAEDTVDLKKLWQSARPSRIMESMLDVVLVSDVRGRKDKRAAKPKPVDKTEALQLSFREMTINTSDNASPCKLDNPAIQANGEVRLPNGEICSHSDKFAPNQQLSNFDITVRTVISELQIETICETKKFNESITDLNETPLMLIARNCAPSSDSELVQTVIVESARPDVLSAHDTMGQTAIAVASCHGNNQLLVQLKQLVPEETLRDQVNQQDNALKTPLMQAAATGNVEAVKLLHDMGADVNMKDSEHFTALMHAARQGFKNTVTELVKCESDVRTQDLLGNTPLIWAARESHVEVIEELCKSLTRPEDWKHVGEYRMTALQWAQYLGHAACAALIKNAMQQVQADTSNGTSGQGTWSETISSPPICVSNDVPAPQLPAVQDLLPRYPMSNQMRGVALVINNIEFRGSHSARRDGAMTDTSENHGIYAAFRRLGLEPEIHTNMNAHFFTNMLTHNRPLNDYMNHDVYVMCVMSHGDLGSVKSSDGERVKLDDLFRQVFDCRELADKPKIFIIQSCRETGQSSQPDSSDREAVLRLETIGQENCLFVYSVVPGRPSYRHVNSGSFFIRSLADAIMQSDLRSTEFTHLLPGVFSRVGDETLRITGTRQVPQYMSTLTKLLYFYRK